jgi:hypothetical protein
MNKKRKKQVFFLKKMEWFLDKEIFLTEAGASSILKAGGNVASRA